VDGLVVRELVWQRAQQRQDGDEAPVHRGCGVQDVHLQGVAGLRAADVDRPGDEVRPWSGGQRHAGQAGDVDLAHRCLLQGGRVVQRRQVVPHLRKHQGVEAARVEHLVEGVQVRLLGGQ